MPAITSPTRASTPRIPIGLPTRLPQAVPTRVCLRRTICGRCSGKSSFDLAEKESCVIVGRCADYILQDRNDCLRVFIHADMQKRAERIVKVYGETDESPEKRLADKGQAAQGVLSLLHRYGVGQVAALSPVP